MANPSQRAVFWALLAATMIAGAMSSIEHPRQNRTWWEEVRRRRSMEVRMGKERPTFKGERYTDGRRSARAVTGKECTAAMCLSQLTITSPTEVRETYPIPTNHRFYPEQTEEIIHALWIALSWEGGSAAPCVGLLCNSATIIMPGISLGALSPLHCLPPGVVCHACQIAQHVIL
jgi:hypothetical protein